MEKNEFKQGVIYALCAYTLWGFAPLYFKYIDHIDPLEIIMHRIIWSFALLLLLVLAMGQWNVLKDILARPKQLVVLAIASVLVGSNWLIFIWAVNNDRMLEASLGYFINPLLNVALGMLFLGERLPRLQLFAVAIAFFGVSIQVVLFGTIPWISLALAGSFGVYGLIKKKIKLKALTSLCIETAILTPPAIVYWFFLESESSSFVSNEWSLNLTLISAGIVTTLPLLAFGAAATRLPYYVQGLFQYIGPSLMFILAIVVFNEELDQTKFITFGFIWLALFVFVFDMWRKARKKRSAAHLE
jgi:chloramphenicol-sensitive protein RarD